MDFNSNIELIIPEPFIKDLTIFYKGKDRLGEIKTSKEEFIRKCHYFKNRENEINKGNEIIIHDEFPFDTFEKFIMSLETKKIKIDSNNYLDYYKLSSKYMYNDLKNQVEEFIRSRPDLNFIINQLSTNQNQEEGHCDEFSSFKEELIAQNLDICLQNNLLQKLPEDILLRIITSPKRVLKDHHLLFLFIKNKLNQIKNKSNLLTDEKETKIQNYEMILSCLDLNQISYEDLIELLKYDLFPLYINTPNSLSLVKNIMSERIEMNEKWDRQEKEIENLKEEIHEMKSKFKNEISKRDNSESLITNKLEILENRILSNEISITNTNEKADTLNIKTDTMKNDIGCLKYEVKKSKELHQQEKNMIEEIINKENELDSDNNQMNKEI